MSILSCLKCEEKFLPVKDGQETCSRKCRDAVRYQRKKANGTGYVPRVRADVPRQAHHEKSCTECGASFLGTERQKFCSPTCRYRLRDRLRLEAGYYKQPRILKRQADHHRERYRRDVSLGKAKGDGSRLAVWAAHGIDGLAGVSHAFRACVVDNCSRQSFARLKCKPHYEREMRLEGREWAHSTDIAGDDYRRRAERFGVAFEQFDKFDIFDRDGWTCGICLDPVDPELMYPDPMSVSLDHVVPLSRGGGHLKSNTQCSHLSCNVRKGARVDGGIELAGIA